ncbi:MAG: VWA domain-containing protein, partial [Acidobacteria bacterium]|nr:VWA domain-containing protein [Candidatus Polarisedimenticola svalbardensis]
MVRRTLGCLPFFLVLLPLVVADDIPQKQEPAPAVVPELREKVHVVLRQIDFLVLDKKGNPVTDLRGDEIQVFEDGVRQEIEDLKHADEGVLVVVRHKPEASVETMRENDEIEPTAEPVETIETVRTPRWFILLFDTRNLSYQNRVRSGRAIKDLMEREFRPGDRVALLVDDDELRVVVPPSSRIEEVLQNLETIEGISDKYRDLEVRLRDLREDAESCRDAPDIHKCARQSATNFLFETSRETETSLDHLESLVLSLGAIPERKILFYVSEGIITNPGDVAAAAVEYAVGQHGYRLNRMRFSLARDFSHRLDRIYQIATRNRVGFYPVNGFRKMYDELFAPERRHDYGPENPAQARRDEFETSWNQVRKLHDDLASATGGVALFKKDPAGLLDDMLRSSAGVYTVSYYPSNRSIERRKIRLEIKRPKVRLHYKNKYKPAMGNATRLGGELIVDTEKYEPATGLLTARLTAAATRLAIAPDSNPPVSVASMYFSVLDGQGRLITDLFEIIILPRSNREAAGEERLERPFAVRIPPGEYSLRVEIRDSHGPVYGSYSSTFSVGGAAPDGDESEG